MSEATVLAPAVRDRVERSLGKRIRDASPVQGGYTPAARSIVTFEDGSTAFAKVGRDVGTSMIANWLRVEHRAYTSIDGPFMPDLLGWDDDGVDPILVIADLSHATWPPPWTGERLDTLWATLEEVRSTPPPSWARDMEEEREHLSGWKRVASDPEPFLSMGLASRSWIERSLPPLTIAASRARLAGNALVHFDVRSDNLCFLENRAKLIDWNQLGRGNPEIDRLSVLPSVHSEGGPPPWSLVEDSGGFAPLLAGYFAAQAGLSVIPTAPHVRRVQLEQLRSALPWAVRELDLPEPDGPRAQELLFT